MGFEVGLAQVKVPAFKHGPDGLISVLGELLELDLFMRVIIRAKGPMPPAENMDPVGNLVELVPHPVFFDHCRAQGLEVHVARNWRTEKGLSQMFGQYLLTFFYQLKAIERQGCWMLVEPLLTGSEQVHEKEVVLPGHRFHGSGVEGKVNVFSAAIRGVMGRREIFKGKG